MEVQLQIKMNEKLFLRDPEQTELGKKIIRHSIQLIYKHGFELFTFKKLAEDIGTTEAGIYRYFENKHRLLIYITAWYYKSATGVCFQNTGKYQLLLYQYLLPVF